MDIKAIPDIVLEVSKAASPAREAAAVLRLSQGVENQVSRPQSADVGPSDWSFAVTRAANTVAAPVGQTVVERQVSEHATTSANGRLDAAKSPAMQFEAFVLQTFVEAMLPKEADGVFGTGTSGDIWRSMLAEHIAAEVARSGGLGIANVISEAPA